MVTKTLDVLSLFFLDWIEIESQYVARWILGEVRLSTEWLLSAIVLTNLLTCAGWLYCVKNPHFHVEHAWYVLLYQSQSDGHRHYQYHLGCSHTLWFGLHYETYIGISPYRTLAVDWAQCMVGYVIMSCVSWSCQKIQTVFIFRAICENTAHVQRTRCSPIGSHLIHWTSAVFSHIALKWTPFAYLINLLLGEGGVKSHRG